MSIDFHLPRADQRKLTEALGTIPTLADQLAVTVTRQSHIQKSGLGKPRRQKPGSRIPYHIGAAEAADNLRNALVTWVRFTCEARQIHYHGGDDIMSHARWLRRNMIQLALTEGSEEALNDITAAIDDCSRQVDLPPDDELHIDRDRIEAANRQVLTAGQIEKIAHKLGDLGKRLTVERVHGLNRRGHLRPVSTDPQSGTKFYRLGDILHAHLACEQRDRKAGKGSETR